MSGDTLVWEALSPREAYGLFRGLSVPWWIAGGWAIDLHVGHQTREHGDTDILILRRDQLAVQEHLNGWDLHKTQQPGLKPWPPGEYLTPPVNDVWCRRTPDSPWSFDLMLLEAEGDRWIYRREPRITGPISGLGKTTSEGLPYLSPEVQLLYKARKEAADKDECDFNVVLPLLSNEERRWLEGCLAIQFPEGHDWIARIRDSLKEA